MLMDDGVKPPILEETNAWRALISPCTSEGIGQLPYPERARRSCCALQVAARELDLPAWLDFSATQRFAESLDVGRVREVGAALASDPNATRIDRSFASIQQEAGMIGLMHALDFGGGWRQELHAYHGRGAWATVKSGVVAMFDTRPDLPAAWLAEMPFDEVERFFALEGTQALRPFVSGLVAVCNEIGQELTRRRVGTVGEFIIAMVEEHRSHPSPAAALVQVLADGFPGAFDDRHTIRGRSIYFYKKAQLVVGELYHRFRGEDARFAFKDGDRLTAFVDNVISAVLRKQGMLVVSNPLGTAIDAHQQLSSGSEQEVSLRAAALAGVEGVALAIRARGEFLTPVELGNYLWGYLGKTPAYRQYTRHATKDTVFY
jgi:hypothetical protein